jgi:uncharacterized protein YjiS (DUF1127 family)
MPSLTVRAARRALQVHQINLGAALARGWRRWCLRWARHSQRTVLRELADDPHLLEDIGVTRAEALKEAERQVWDITDVYVHSL